jgi:hypothetical protein
MNEQKVGVVLMVIGMVTFFLGWVLDRSELRGRSLRGRPRALVSTIATWGGTRSGGARIDPLGGLIFLERE